VGGSREGPQKKHGREESGSTVQSLRDKRVRKFVVGVDQQRRSGKGPEGKPFRKGWQDRGVSTQRRQDMGVRLQRGGHKKNSKPITASNRKRNHKGVGANLWKNKGKG